jgi:hypothetical protein
LEEFQINQETSLISKFIHFFKSNDTDELFKMYALARKNFGRGGEKRIIHTLTPLIHAYIKLSKTIFQNALETEYDLEKVFSYLKDTISVLSTHNPTLTFTLFLESTLISDKCNSPKNLYSFLSESFILFEEIDSKLKLEYLIPMINTVQSLVHISPNNYETLTEKLCQYVWVPFSIASIDIVSYRKVSF